MAMKALDPQIAEICRVVRITDYLETKGVNLIKSGKRTRCLCPLPSHKDTDPSFYITTLGDGTQLFKCFGCHEAGNIITLMSKMEDESKGKIVKKLRLKRA